MNLFVKELPPETQILIAMGAAVAAGCQPCLAQLVDLAQGEELAIASQRAAVTIGQFVKDQPAREIQALAHTLLGEDPGLRAADIPCPCGDEAAEDAACCG